MQPSQKQRVRPLAGVEAPVTVGFRLDADHSQALTRRAVKAGLSPHELARQFVVEALHDNERLSVLEQAVKALCAEMQELHRDLLQTTREQPGLPAVVELVNTLKLELDQSRRDLALSVFALLVAAGKSMDEAKAWVQKHLRTT
ncbi:MAG: hypothetical protein M5U12_33985 [Verrucomicrobia bacterium]|nr:hypothetical protein [Verrucomicrobiota bacterium]